MLRPAMFFDRDGIINQPPSEEQYYITDPDDFHLMPGFVELLRFVTAAGWPAVVVTNQKCIAIGRLTEEGLAAIHARMHALLSEEGLAVLDVKYCPHDDEARCNCRKPLPGMLLAAAAEHEVDLSRSWLVGDQPRDCEAGKTAGCSTILVNGSAQSPHADFVCKDLFACAEILMERLDVKPYGLEK